MAGEEPDVSALQRAASASIGSVLTSLFMTPFDVVKVRLQSGTRHSPPAPAVPAHRRAPWVRRMASGVVQGRVGVVAAGGRGGVCVEGGIRCFRVGGASCLRQQCERFVQQCKLGKRVLCGEWPEQVRRRRRRGGVGGARAMLGHILREEGARGLWRGLSPALVMAVPSTTLYMVVYTELRLRMQRNAHSNGWVVAQRASPLLAAAVARTMVTMAVSPLDLVRTKMQSALHGNSMGLLAGLRAEIEAGGVRALYRGVGPTLWRDVPYSALYWFGYESIRSPILALLRKRSAQKRKRAVATASARQTTAKHTQKDQKRGGGRGGGEEERRYALEKEKTDTLKSEKGIASAETVASKKTTQSHTPTPLPPPSPPDSIPSPPPPPPLSYWESFLAAFFSGAVAGIGAGTLATPFDVAKTRRQVLHMHPRSSAHAPTPPLPTSTFALLRNIAKHEGLQGIFAGLTPRLLRVAPASAIMISSYELGMKAFEAANT